MLSSPHSFFFWAANVAAAPLWLCAVLAPQAAVTLRLWRSPWVALPFTVAFSALVLPQLPWWLGQFAGGELSLAGLVRGFAGEEQFLLLWLYILGFDVLVFAQMHAELMRRRAHPLEMACLALATALCAPLGYSVHALRQWQLHR
jgi:hypothetical protein